MKRVLTVLVGGGVLVCLGAGSSSLAARARDAARSVPLGSLAARQPVPVESPGRAECYRWTYPKKASCGNLSGTKECKSRPTIESSDDEKKREECQPTKGDICLCD
jgi:hypothetical protein